MKIRLILPIIKEVPNKSKFQSFEGLILKNYGELNE